MLRDPHGRKISYLRISVTDKCNYRCVYCMPPEGVARKPHNTLLRHEDMIRIARVASELGIGKVRLTGGEPLIKKNIEFLVAGLARLPRLNELCLTTNGSLLTPRKARALKRMGLHRVNISLDTLDSQRFAEITRGGRVEEVIAGIEAAVEADLTPVKVNMVIGPETSGEEQEAMRDFCTRVGATLQTINRFFLHGRTHASPPGADRPGSCAACNRLRLTADGNLKPCLFSDQEVKVDLFDIRGSILQAVANKPRAGSACLTRTMSQIGG